MTDNNQEEITKPRPVPRCPPWVHLVAGGYVQLLRIYFASKSVIIRAIATAIWIDGLGKSCS